uniref:Transporter n=1 Tax=Caenorhabditis japonica TaxID=281687 RepID=A0A8R1DUW0_CAEJA
MNSVNSSPSGTTQRRSPISLEADDQHVTTAIEKEGVEGDGAAIDQCRGAWGNQMEFLLSTLGMAVGLGNIWRFPTRAYNNGGSAFLVPYISCALLFGLPAVYLEFVLGQYHRATAPVIFRRFAPILQGVGWMAVAVSSLVAIYYIIIIGWSTVYMASIIGGYTGLWNRCGNPWNLADTCLDLAKQPICRDYQKTSNYTPPVWANLSAVGRNVSYIYFNSTCYDKVDLAHNKTVTATEQFFFNYVVTPSSGFSDFNSVNWRSFLGVNICWIIVVFILWKGVDYMGKASYVIVTLPYIIIVLLFFRGITLDGANEGLYYYLGNPDWSKVFTPATWGEALKQLCFSLGIGYGGLIGLSSFSKPDNNCYRDALIVIIGDTTMSLVGGAAVFSTLGFLAKQKGCEVADVVNDGFSLAFVAFPEALGRMPLPELWSFLFFLMLFFLGISTEVAYVNVFCTAICDQFVRLRKHKWMVVVAWCLFLYCIGVVMVTDGGFYWFIMFDEYAAGVSSCVAVTAEVLLVAYVYGRKNMLDDIGEMLGPHNNVCGKYFGCRSPYFGFNWMVITPLLGSILIILASIREYPYMGKPDVYPLAFDVVGWIVCMLPVAMVPLFAIFAYFEFKRNGHDMRSLFMKQRQLRSYSRIYDQMTPKERLEQKFLPDREPWDNKPTGFQFSSSASTTSRSSGDDSQHSEKSKLLSESKTETTHSKTQ